MEKKQTIKLDLDEKSVKKITDFLTGIKADFNISISNYTTKIETAKKNFYFVKTLQSNRTFAAATMIKKDLQGKAIPVIDSNNNLYYSCMKTGDFYSDKIHNVDINNCYANILKNNGLITQKTFDYLNTLKKPERLAAIGSIASKKSVYTYVDGKIIKEEEINNPNANFFYFCVQETNRIISEVRHNVLFDEFVFYWVDGIYFLNEFSGAVVQNYLKSKYNLESKKKELTDFNLVRMDDFNDITFLEDGKRKKFCVPADVPKYKKQITNYLLTKTYKK
jgi:hypothetical protein